MKKSKTQAVIEAELITRLDYDKTMYLYAWIAERIEDQQLQKQ